MARTLDTQPSSRVELWRGIDGMFRSRKWQLAVNRVRRVLRFRNYWYWIEAPELADGIEIATIVCPLRYDVLVRRDFFSFYASHLDLCDADWDAFVDLTRGTSYYTWYLESEAVRTNAHLRSDPGALELDFEKRIRRAITLYESVQKDGFSTRFPITLKTAKRLLPPTTDRGGPPTGKRVGTKYFLADGCHRLALLMALGFHTLPANYFRVKYYQEFSPFDSTSLLARRLLREPSDYFRYLSTYYTAPEVFSNRNDLMNHVERHKPELLDEVESVIRADGFDGERDR